MLSGPMFGAKRDPAQVLEFVGELSGVMRQPGG
jgi:hypothetical protein